MEPNWSLALNFFCPPFFFRSKINAPGWKPQRLALVSLIMPWLDVSTRTEQFQEARAFLNDYKRWTRFPKTYQGYAKAIKNDGGQLATKIENRFQQQLPALAGKLWRWKSWVVLAVDGSRLECPRTLVNQEALGCAGRDKTGPQIMLTVLYHLGTSLPYASRVGPGIVSEQRQLDAMLDDLPPRTLMLADAGFFSAKLAHQLISRGHAFLFRVGGNKHLLTELFDEFEFDSNQQVWVWTDEMKRNKQPPLSLRLIEIKTPRVDQPNVFLLTNLSKKELSDREANELYPSRWGVEVFFRDAKQTLESRKLKSRTPELALAEASWLVLSLFLLGALVVHQQSEKRKVSPRWSAAKTRNVVRRRIRYRLRQGGRWNKSLCNELRRCLIDNYQRTGSKRARDYPQKKRERPPQPPKRRAATKQEREAASRLTI